MKNAFNRRRKINQDDLAYVIYISHLCKNFPRELATSKIIILEKEGCKNNAIEIKLAATSMEHRTLPEYVERNCVNI